MENWNILDKYLCTFLYFNCFQFAETVFSKNFWPNFITDWGWHTHEYFFDIDALRLELVKKWVGNSERELLKIAWSWRNVRHCNVLQAHPRIIFLDSTSITKKFRYSLEKLPGSWNFCFFYFEHCVLAISKLHLPTCLTKIGEFHSIKCLFWTPIFFMITVFHTMAINIFFLEIYGIFWKSRSF